MNFIVNSENNITTNIEQSYFFFNIERFKDIWISKGFQLVDPTLSAPSSKLSNLLSNQSVLDFLNSEKEIVCGYEALEHDRLSIFNRFNRDYLCFLFDGQSWVLGDRIIDSWGPGIEIKRYNLVHNGVISFSNL